MKSMHYFKRLDISNFICVTNYLNWFILMNHSFSLQSSKSSGCTGDTGRDFFSDLGLGAVR